MTDQEIDAMFELKRQRRNRRYAEANKRAKKSYYKRKGYTITVKESSSPSSD